MRVKTVLLALCSMALAAVLAAPSYAQTIINQPAGDPGTTQTLQNVELLNLPATSLQALIGQSAINQVNQIGSGNLVGQPLSWLGVGTPYTLQQQAGDATNGNAFTVTQTANNSITVENGALPALSTVIAGGFQNAANAVNSAFFNPVTGSLTDPTVSTGSLTQVSSNAFLTATNLMSATVQNGAASVIGNNGVDSNGAPVPGYQQAYTTINTGGVLTSISTTLQLEQKLGSQNLVVNTNTALANSIASTSSSLDPSILTLNQDSRLIVNQFDFQSVTTGTPPTPTQTVVNLSGFQPGGLVPTGVGTTVGLLATIGNMAIAYTGATGADYNIGKPAVPGDGTAVINGVTQNTFFSLNTITGVNGSPGAGINYSAASDAGGTNPYLSLTPYNSQSAGFLQYVDTTTYALTTVYDQDPNNTTGQALTGVVNALAARVNNGSASIIGAVRTAATDPVTQQFTNTLNSAVVGGTVSGTLTQAVVGMDQSTLGGSASGVSYTGYVNLAVANASVGPASLTNVSQSMSQALNTAGSGAAAGFTLNQSVTSPAEGCTLCSNNIQVAAGSSLATISGAQQFTNNTVNVASLGSVNGGSITQTTTNVSIKGVNQLVTLTNGNATINGTQSSFSAINVVK